MSWTKDSQNGMYVAEETYTLPASATIGYSTAISEVGPNLSNNNRYVSFTFNASAVSGTNLDIALYGASSATGDKVLLKDAIVADITATGIVAGVIDLNAYPAPYYFLAWTADADESANTIDVQVMG